MSLTIDLDGRTAIVSGGGRGIGRRICEEFARSGANVAIAARTEEEITAVAESLERYGIDALAIQTDLTEYGDIDKLVRRTETELGQPDILVNNAGLNLRGDMADRPQAEVEDMVAVNFRGVFYLSRRFAASYADSPAEAAGRIINISSILGHVGVPSRTVYGGTKAGVIGLTRGLAAEFAPAGITVNSISPGRMLVDRITDRSAADGDGRMDPSQIPLGRFGSPEEVAYLSLFLASDYADYITGEDILIDGGVHFTSAAYPVKS